MSFVSGYPGNGVASVATVAALPACTYDNGTAGVGATLTGSANGAVVVGPVSVGAAGWSVLVKNQAAALQNGYYIVTQLGSASLPFILTRAAGFDSSSFPTGTFGVGDSGTSIDGTMWVYVNNNPTIGVDPIVFGQFATGPGSSPLYVDPVTGAIGMLGWDNNSGVGTPRFRGRLDIQSPPDDWGLVISGSTSSLGSYGAKFTAGNSVNPTTILALLNLAENMGARFYSDGAVNIGDSNPPAMARFPRGLNVHDGYYQAGHKYPDAAAFDFAPGKVLTLANDTVLDSGTWVPGLSFDRNSVGIAYYPGRQVGTWTRVGNMVFISGEIAITNKGTSAGVGYIENLPFTVKNINNSNPAIAGLHYSNMTGLTGAANGLLVRDTKTINLQQSSSTGSVDLTDAAFTSTTGLMFSAFYQI